jgi:hypothetical protein
MQVCAAQEGVGDVNERVADSERLRVGERLMVDRREETAVGHACTVQCAGCTERV